MRIAMLAALGCLMELASPLLPTSAVADDWFRFRGPQLNGVSSETHWSHAWQNQAPAVVWRGDVGIGLSGIVVSDGRAYTLGNRDDTDTVFCFDAQTGRQIWHHDYLSPLNPNEFEGGPTSTPTVDADRLFTLSRTGELFCFDKATGQVLWHIQVAEVAGVRVPTWGFAGSPLVSGDRLIVNVGEAGVAVNKHTGARLWASADRDAGYSSLVPLTFAEQPAVVFGSARAYVCVNVITGQELWRERWLTTFGCNAADPIVTGQQLFISSGYNRGCALFNFNATGIEPVWKNKEMQNQISSCVLIAGHLYGIHGDVGAGTQLRCMELASGEVKWSDTTFHPGGLSAAGERLIVLSDDGELLIAAASPAACHILARQRLLDGKCWTAPVLSNGQIFCRSAQGELVCARVGNSN